MDRRLPPERASRRGPRNQARQEAAALIIGPRRDVRSPGPHRLRGTGRDPGDADHEGQLGRGEAGRNADGGVAPTDPDEQTPVVGGDIDGDGYAELFVGNNVASLLNSPLLILRKAV